VVEEEGEEAAAEAVAARLTEERAAERAAERVMATIRAWAMGVMVGKAPAALTATTRMGATVTRAAMMVMICLICLPPRGTSPHQDSAGTAPSSTPPAMEAAAMMMICLPPRGTSPHQDSADTVPSSTPPAMEAAAKAAATTEAAARGPAQPPPPLQTRAAQPHSARTPLKRHMRTSPATSR